ncbi:MAG: tripartite tricarboxylate transporter TctB family protein [Deltaproteobacteria bacterium]|nr:tripartite tricarboxylate transporter TctB family protein [Deltaproteobacteria bacterium]
MKNRDIISSLFWMAMGIGICYGGYDLHLGSLRDPGPGFIFFWVGVIMIGLSLIILIKAVREKGQKGELKVLWTGIRWQKAVSVLAALFIYAYVLTPLGFILTTILLLIFLFMAVEPQKLSWAILGAIVFTLAAYGLFQFWLGCQLPQGFLGV